MYIFLLPLQKHYYRLFEMAKNAHYYDGFKIVIQRIQTDHGDDIEVVLKDKVDQEVPEGIKELNQGVHFQFQKHIIGDNRVSEKKVA